MLKKKLSYVLLGAITAATLQMAPVSSVFAETTFTGSVGIDVGGLLLSPFYHNDNSGVGIGIGVGPNSLLPGALPGQREGEESPFYKEGILAVVKGDSGYGVVDINGKVVIAPAYKSIQPQHNGDFVAKTKDKKEIIFNSKGKELPAEVAIKTVNADDLYSFKDREKKRYGFKNGEGQVVIAPQFKEIYTEFSEGRAFVKDNKRHLVAIDKNGNTLFRAKYDAVFPYHDGLAEVHRQVSRLGLGAIVGRYFGDKGSGAFSGLGGAFYENVKRGYINLNGEEVISSRAHRVYPMTQYGVVVENKGMLGFMGRDGQYIIAPGKYEAKSMDLTHGYIALKDKKDNKVGALSLLNGKEIIPFAYENITFLTHNLAVLQGQDKQVVVNIANGNVPVFNLSKDAWFNNFGDEGYMWVKGDTMLGKKNSSMHLNTFDGYKVIDLEGNVVYEAKGLSFDKVGMFKHGVSPVRIDKMWGIMNGHGEWIIKPQYEMIRML